MSHGHPRNNLLYNGSVPNLRYGRCRSQRGVHAAGNYDCSDAGGCRPSNRSRNEWRASRAGICGLCRAGAGQLRQKHDSL